MEGGQPNKYHGKVSSIDEAYTNIHAVTPEYIALATAFLKSDRLSSFTF